MQVASSNVALSEVELERIVGDNKGHDISRKYSGGSHEAGYNRSNSHGNGNGRKYSGGSHEAGHNRSNSQGDDWKYSRSSYYGSHGSYGNNHYPPSDPRFDRSNVPDNEYIKQLLFENKELKGLVEEKNRTIERLQRQLSLLSPNGSNGNNTPLHQLQNNVSSLQSVSPVFVSSPSRPHPPPPIDSPPLPPHLLQHSITPKSNLTEASHDEILISPILQHQQQQSRAPKQQHQHHHQHHHQQHQQHHQRNEYNQRISLPTSKEMTSSPHLDEIMVSPSEIPVRSSLRSSELTNDKPITPKDNRRSSMTSDRSAAYLPNSVSNASNLSSNVSSRYSPIRVDEEKEKEKSDLQSVSNIPGNTTPHDDTMDSLKQSNMSIDTKQSFEHTLNTVESLDLSRDEAEDTIDSQYNLALESLKSQTDNTTTATAATTNTTNTTATTTTTTAASSSVIYTHNKQLARSTSSIGSTYKSSRIKPPFHHKLMHGNHSTTELAPPTSLKAALGEKNSSRNNISAYNTPPNQVIANYGVPNLTKNDFQTPEVLSDEKFEQFESPSSKLDEKNMAILPSPVADDSLKHQHSYHQAPASAASSLSAAAAAAVGALPLLPPPNSETQYSHNNQNQRLASPYNLQQQQPTYYTGRPLQTPTSSKNNIHVLSPQTPGSSFNVLNTPKTDMDESSLFIKPEEFHTIFIKVISTIHIDSLMNQTSAKKTDDPNITITINDRETNKEMWRIRKTHSQICSFDAEVRSIIEYFGMTNLPDKTSFASTTPSKIEARRALLQNYFNSIFLMPHIPHIVLYKLCLFLSLDFVNPLDDFKSGSRKEGYLVRKYKGIGTSWKVRWCQIENNQLEVYPFPGGQLQESISLYNAQIGRQAADSVAEDKGYRHAFLVMESPKASKLHSTTNKYFFCAETDEERDDWVTALIEFTEIVPSPEPKSADVSPQKPVNYADATTPADYDKKFSYDNYNEESGSPVSYANGKFASDQVSFQTSISTEEQGKRMKKRSYFSFRNRASSNASEQGSQPLPPSQPQQPPPPPQQQQQHQQQHQQQQQTQPQQPPPFPPPPTLPLPLPPQQQQLPQQPQPIQLQQQSRYTYAPVSNGYQSGVSQVHPIQVDSSNSMQQYLDELDLGNEVTKSIFGREIEVALELSSHDYMGRHIPSICFRCLDYLNRTGAIFEEGIFRLSGSASTIRQLKEAFNREHDLDLFRSPLKPDIHTVSGLFKTYLRELPSPILGTDAYLQLNNIVLNKHNKFLPSQIAIMFKEYLNNSNNIDAIHYDLCYVIFKFLRQIISQNQINRMNLKNLCIVFVPTLNLSLEVLSTILIDFECIFENGKPVSDSNREVLDLHIPNF
ncbi:BEM3 [Candida oxycetoniae]|uniref:BEM3 n=1 Tax=Candida oxycetoniae TaxID=497107 RepID=A0AAI9WWH4_9ASCO|nr:BEM3 [Candida oxycetoniae]KAI3403171.2 BEM3 [Candida oxycetoniae]